MIGPLLVVDQRHPPDEDDGQLSSPGHWWAQPDHPGESRVFLPGVGIGDEGAVPSGTASSTGGSNQSTQCHVSLQTYSLWIAFKAMFIPHTASWARIQTSRPHLYTEGRTQTRNSQGLFHCFHLLLWLTPPLSDLPPLTPPLSDSVHSNLSLCPHCAHTRPTLSAHLNPAHMSRTRDPP